MGKISREDEILISRVNVHGDPHLGAGMIGCFRGAIQTDAVVLAPVFRKLVKWYGNKCETAARLGKCKPTRSQVDEKFSEFFVGD